jgi:serine/threonine-protein kinase HipA
LSINGKRKAISKNDMLVIGKSIKCKQASVIIEEIESTVMNWKKFANEVGLSAKLRDAIDKTIKDWN